MPSDRGSSPITIEELLEHGRWVKRLAARLVVGEEAAEELAQASMVQALTHPPPHKGNLKGWFAVVARNLARGQGTDARREAEMRRIAAEMRVVSVEEGERIVSRLEFQRLISESLLDLAPTLRDALVLRFYDELSFREIGERLGIPADTVRSRVARGLTELRRSLDDRGGEDAVDWRSGVLLWLAPAGIAPSAASAGAGGGTALGTLGAPLQAAALGLLLVSLAALGWWGSSGAADRANRRALQPGATAGRVRAAEPAGRAVSAERRDPLEGAAVASLEGAPVELVGRLRAVRGKASLAGATLRLLTVDGRGRTLAATARTDAFGRFRFDAPLAPYDAGPRDMLPALDGLFVLRAEAEGFASLELQRSKYDLDGPGEGALDADLGDLRLAPAHEFELALRGAWRDAVGLWLGSFGERMEASDYLRRVGEWTAAGVHWDDRLGAVAEGGSRAPLLAWDGAGLGFAELDPTLEPDGPAAIVIERLPDAAARVQVRDAAGGPVAGAEVRATPLYWPLRSRHYLELCEHGVSSRPSGWDAARRSRTDENGVARFEVLPAAPAGVDEGSSATLAEGLHAAGTYRFCVGGYGTGLPHRVSQAVRLRAGEEARIAWMLPREAGAPLAGRIVDARGEPVAGVPVVAVDQIHTEPFRGGQGSPVAQHAITDEGGRFAFDRVDRRGQGVETILLEGDAIGKAWQSFQITVPPEGRTDCEWVLHDAVRLEGWLTGAEGASFALERLRLFLRPEGSASPAAERPAADERLLVRSDGFFALENLPRGRWTLLPDDFESHGLVPFDPIVFEAHEDVSLVIPVESLEANSTRLELVLRDPTRGAPPGIARADALCVREDRGTPLVIAAEIRDGARRAVFDALPPGTWHFHLRLHGGRRVWRSIELAESTPRLVEDVELRPPGRLEGVVESRDPLGMLAARRVDAHLVGPEWIDVGPDVERGFAAVGRTAEIGSDGCFRLDDLPPGRWELRVLAGDRVARTIALVEPSGVASVELDLRPSRTLVLTGDLERRHALGHRLRLFVHGEDQRWAPWPFDQVEGGVQARLPHDTRAWEARWWTPGIVGFQRSTPLEGRAAGTLDDASTDTIRTSLPH